MEKEILNKTSYDGKRAKITKRDHPHYDEIAICLGSKKTSIGTGFVFKDTQSDIEYFVFNIKEVKFID